MHSGTDSASLTPIQLAQGLRTVRHDAGWPKLTRTRHSDARLGELRRGGGSHQSRDDGSVSTPPLRRPLHPGQADTLVHFCGRGRYTTAADVADLTADGRLDSILREGALRAYPPYGSSSPVVCFSESDTGGVEAMLSVAGWEPWGVIVSRDWVWRQGGGPVWYVRDEVRALLEPRLDERLRSWLVRTEPQSSDWLHEREWRVPCTDPSRMSLPLAGGALVAILVGDGEWEPSPIDDIDMNPMTGRLTYTQRTPGIALVPRWLWNGQRIEQLSPVPARVECYFDI